MVYNESFKDLQHRKVYDLECPEHGKDMEPEALLPKSLCEQCHPNLHASFTDLVLHQSGHSRSYEDLPEFLPGLLNLINDSDISGLKSVFEEYHDRLLLWSAFMMKICLVPQFSERFDNELKCWEEIFARTSDILGRNL